MDTVPRIHQLIEAGDKLAVLEYLASNPKTIDQFDSINNKPLHTACWEKQVDLIEVLIDAGADVNERGSAGQTPLHLAIQDGDGSSVPLVKRLLEAGADPNIRDDIGYTVAGWAKVQMTDFLPEILKLLRDEPAGQG